MKYNNKKIKTAILILGVVYEILKIIFLFLAQNHPT